jgi:hypothetical protein
VNTLFHLPNSSSKSRQGAPARTSHKHGIREQPIAGAVPAFVAFPAWNKWLNPRPFSVRQCPPNQDRPPRLRSCITFASRRESP